MRLPQRTTPLLLAPLLALLASAPAYADPATDTDIKTPSPSIGIASIAGGIRVCFYGTGHVVAPWTAQLNGTRASTNPALVPITYGFTQTSVSVSQCYDVMKLGSPQGEAAFTFASLGGSNSGNTDRPAAVHGVLAWVTGRQDTWIVTSGG